ncbi:MAG: helix-turn-helix domain-containing protein [Bacteroidales bacterium]|jgi:transposase|nr:helix-turn-helix domain-containing protein [Bacteroidales bacterium]
MGKNIEKRQQLMELVDAGCGPMEISRRLNIYRSLAIEWRLLYLRRGEEEFMQIMNQHIVSSKIKQEVVRAHLENGASINSLSMEYGLSWSGIKKWVDKVKAEGYDALIDSAYGRPKGKTAPKKERPIPPKLLEENRKLKIELELVKTENALLKKVKALVEERDARLRKIGQELSKN